MALAAHPFAKLFPLCEESLEELASDIERNGLREPITLYKGMILDGCRRKKACEMKRITPHYREFSGEEENALNFVVSMNMSRRHLSETQRAFIGAEIATLKAGFTPKDGKKPRLTREHAAVLLNISTDSIDRAKKIEKDGTPELIEAVKEEKISLTAGAKIAGEPDKVQNRIVEEVIEKHAPPVVEKPKISNKDRAGILWPEECMPAVEAKPQLVKFRSSVADLVDEVERFRVGPLGVHVEWGSIYDALEKIRKMCLNGMPDYRCPYCDGTGKASERVTCKPCKGAGWVAEKVWKDSPAAAEMGGTFKE